MSGCVTGECVVSSPPSMPRSILAAALAILLGAAVWAAVDQDEEAASLYAPHGKPGGFFNPWQPFPHGFTDMLWFAVRSNPYDKGRKPEIPIVANDGASFGIREKSAAVTWVGHATVAVHDENDVFLTDPHFTPRALIPSRWTPPGVPIGAIPGDAFAVISHNHYDHLDSGSVDGLPDTMDWYVPLGLADWFRARGRSRVVELDWWQSVERGRWTITCLPAQHWSRRIWQATNASLWCSWLLDNGSRRYFFAGDTGYFHGFREYRRRFGPVDVALLPIGAFEPRDFMAYQHMNPEDTVKAFLELEARWLIPIHWGCFDLSFEPLDEPPKVLREAVGRESRIAPDRVRILAVGERWEIPPS